MKLSFRREMVSIEYFCSFSDLYDGWNDTVGTALSDMANSALSSAKREVSGILNDVKEMKDNFATDIKWIDARLSDLK